VCVCVCRFQGKRKEYGRCYSVSCHLLSCLKFSAPANKTPPTSDVRQFFKLKNCWLVFYTNFCLRISILRRKVPENPLMTICWLSSKPQANIRISFDFHVIYFDIYAEIKIARLLLFPKGDCIKGFELFELVFIASEWSVVRPLLHEYNCNRLGRQGSLNLSLDIIA
jgi:hypothetical protein